MTTKRTGGNGFERAADIPAMKKLAKRYGPSTPAQLALIEAAAAIRENPDAAEIAFMVRQLILCTLPHCDPENPKKSKRYPKAELHIVKGVCIVCGVKLHESERMKVLRQGGMCASCNEKSRPIVEQWTRRSGNLILGITPGRDFENNRSIGYPYGVIPRLLLLWITTEVQRRKNNPELTEPEKRTLQLGASLADFMRRVGLDPGTGRGKRSDAKRLHDQMDRLFSSRISFQRTIEAQGVVGKERLNMEIAPHSQLWWDPKKPEQGALWQSWIRLGQDFFNALQELPVPLDMRALRKLKRSPLDLDMYSWVCYRAYVIVQKKQPPQFTAWSVLKNQLGADYSDENNFEKKAKAALRTVAEFYPGLTIGKAKGGFTIYATRLAVPPKTSELPE